MPAFALPARFVDDSLHEARDALGYWEDRAQRLPRHAVLRRREARAMAMRWSARVAEGERDRYGRGVAGTLLLLVAEGRVPEPARQTGRRLARRAVQGLALASAACVAMLALAVTLVVALVSALI
jgi:hypothetical protein